MVTKVLKQDKTGFRGSGTKQDWLQRFWKETRLVKLRHRIVRAKMQEIVLNGLRPIGTMNDTENEILQHVF